MGVRRDVNHLLYPDRRGKTAERPNMDRMTYKMFNEQVKTAGENDPVWGAGFLWINLTEKQVNKIGDVLMNNECCKKVIVNSRGIERTMIITPTGFRLYTNEKAVIDRIKALLEGRSNGYAETTLLDLYNDDVINCGEYNLLYDWTQEHTDGNGRVSIDW